MKNEGKKVSVDIRKLTMAGCLGALVFVVTRFIQIPIPLGYFNVGNFVILIGCLFMPMGYGVAAGAIGSALADLTSYPAYTLPTLIIKSLMPLVFYLICAGKMKNKTVQTLLAVYVSTLIPLFGYTLTGGILYGNMLTGLAQFPGLLLEYIANAILFTVAYPVAKKIKSPLE
ncbi:MAG: ECF transporter S component [Agathobacter sp.]